MLENNSVSYTSKSGGGFVFFFLLCVKVTVFLPYPLITLKITKNIIKRREGKKIILLKTDIYTSYLKLNLNMLLSLNKK